MLDAFGADTVKPNYDRVKRRWTELLGEYFREDGSLNPKNMVAACCPHCKTADEEAEFVINGFRHVSCQRCQSVYVNPRLRNECLTKLYNDDYYSAAYADSMIPAFGVRKELIGKRKFAQVTAHSVKRGRVLDIGAGVGEVMGCGGTRGGCTPVS